MRCSADRETDAWRLTLCLSVPAKLDGIASLKAWPITVSAGNAADTMGLASTTEVPVGSCALASVTGLIAFEATAAAADQQARFVLNLPLEGLPEGRDAAVMRTVISNQDGFLRYLALLLADLGEDPFAVGIEGGKSDWNQFEVAGGHGDLAILEHLVRALAREPERLRAIQGIVDGLREGDEIAAVIPPEFLSLWRSFERALGEKS